MDNNELAKSIIYKINVINNNIRDLNCLIKEAENNDKLSVNIKPSPSIDKVYELDCKIYVEFEMDND